MKTNVVVTLINPMTKQISTNVERGSKIIGVDPDTGFDKLINDLSISEYRMMLEIQCSKLCKQI